MKNIAISLITFLGVVFSGNAQKKTTTNTNRGHIWKVQKNGKVNYLGGSIHALRDTDLPLPNNYYTALEKSDRVILETDPDAINKPEIRQRIAKEGMITNGKTLQDYISAETYTSLDKVCQKAGIPTAMAIRSKPMMASMMLTFQELIKSGYKITNGIDLLIAKEAKSKGVKIGQLESVEEQLGFLTYFEPKHADEMIQKLCADFEKTEVFMNDATIAVKSGKPESIENLFGSWQKDYPEIYRILLQERNQNWMKQLPTLLENDETTFVLVGAAHLYGEEGLVTSLQKLGYTLEQL